MVAPYTFWWPLSTGYFSWTSTSLPWSLGKPKKQLPDLAFTPKGFYLKAQGKRSAALGIR
jgi:hypothetical protein